MCVHIPHMFLPVCAYVYCYKQSKVTLRINLLGEYSGISPPKDSKGRDATVHSVLSMKPHPRIHIHLTYTNKLLKFRQKEQLEYFMGSKNYNSVIKDKKQQDKHSY